MTKMGKYVPMSAAPATLSPLEEAIAAVLRAERAAARVDLDALATATGISKRSLIRYLAGERPMSVKQINLIADALGLDFRTVFDRAEERLRNESAG
jgi:transcriptional regulator with XRE-family HTH domain